MILECPNCGAKFDLPPTALGATGRRVRCSACRHEWFATPPEEAFALPPPMPAEPPPQPAPRQAAPMRAAAPPAQPAPSTRGTRPGLQIPLEDRSRPSGGGRIGLAIGWFLFIVVAAIVVGGYFLRAPIVCRVPEARAVYDYVRIPLPSGIEGLTITSAPATRETRDGRALLIVEGIINNASGCTRILPQLRGAMILDNRETQNWLFDATAGRVSPGDAVPFRTEVPDPGNAQTVTITLAPAG